MKVLKTQAIVLSRTDYQEADRIINVLTKDQGKIALMARGVRRPKSKLAAGIELFCVSSISYIKGQSEIGTLISAKPEINYEHIVEDISRVERGYNLIKILNTNIEHHAEDDYYGAIKQALSSLNNLDMNDEFVESWFIAQVLRISGHSPNLLTDENGDQLSFSRVYNFSVDSMCFEISKNGSYNADAIKCLRLIFSKNPPETIIKISGFMDKFGFIKNSVKQMRNYYLN